MIDMRVTQPNNSYGKGSQGYLVNLRTSALILCWDSTIMNMPLEETAERQAEPRTDEHRLVERCCAGDERAWDALFERYFPLICHVGRQSWGWSMEDAEDVAQGAFVKLVHALPQYRGGSLKSFVLKVAKRHSLDEVDKRTAKMRRAERMTEALDELETLGCAAGQAPEVRANLSCEALLQQLDEILKALPAPCDELIPLRFRDAMSYEEIAAVRAIPFGTAASQLNRCIERLSKAVAAVEVDCEVLEKAALLLEERL